MNTTELTREDLATVSPAWWAAALVAVVLLAVTFAVEPGLFIDQAIGGLVYGMVLVLVTLGLSLILGLMGIVNFAHGAFFMLGAYLSYSVVVTLGLPFWAALILAPLAVGVVGVVLEITVLRYLYGSDPIVSLLATFGLTMMIEEVIRAYWGTAPLEISRPSVLTRGTDLGVTTVPTYRLFLVGVAVLTIVAVYLLISRTDFGLTVRAGVQDGEMTEFVGVNLPVRFTAMFFLGAALAGFAGVLYSAETGMRTTMGETFVILAFVVVVVGGIGSLFGSVVSGILIGVSAYLTPVVLSALAEVTNQPWLALQIRDLVPYLVMILILLYRPRGLFGEEGFLE
ncbi:branched-chain amino acid ABC transporter permease [Haloarchaeobius iranensis]|uniref:Amino acid/amide ABC transporter membrane protein 1, HAAT family n=1 Tax=Haloarchaeobius iranensis TaxID=996166 RepID=A0A1G9Y9E1_9EURY|nr:branched-chain amino acid ABC transporter permease [Haloarchaeobius iranensis]SDN05155.1 amino acid/amide ABC transporter membrane protein 1, HAAT family [Haloarchaeobius iranensis]